MKIYVQGIPEGGLDIDDEVRVESETSGIVKTARLRGRIERFGEDVFLRGEVTAGLNLQCGRCLKDFSDTVTVNLELVYSPAEAQEVGEGHEPGIGEIEAGFYVGEEIDIGKILKEQVLLNLPMKPLCSDSCRGICPSCGIDLNEKTCECGDKFRDHRFQALGKLLKSERSRDG